ncbi:ABC transporter substrate-binding protein [Halorarius halobius]|uniref:ABC transporter substrate-binding protein n=1 Tax=Halorarius halobius TaxID=2962671 RepID=UPI0020CF62A8|nr:ABC transporter substrate-binding protein [Halorarius halobius]
MSNDENVGRRSFLKATGVSATAAALAGCTDTIGGGGGGGVPETIKVGVLGPADSPMGSSILNTAKLAAGQINDAGGIAGSDVEVFTKDTKDDPATTRSAYQELTTGQNVHATTGIFGSENLLSIMGNIAEAGTPHLTAGAATPEAPRRVKEDYEKFKYWFRTGPVNSNFLAESLIQFANDRFESMGWEKVAFIAEDFKWTEPVTQRMQSDLASTGVEVSSVKRVAEGTEDFTPIYDELEGNDVDGAFTALAHIGTTSLVQWAKQQRSFGYGGIHVPTQLPSFYKATKGAAISTFSQTTATPQSEITEKTVPYANAYQEEFGGYPVYTGYSVQDAMYMLKNAIEGAESVNGDDIVSELEGMSYTGTAGTVEFYGQDAEFPHDVKYGEEFTRGVYFQWQQQNDSGTQQVIWPDKYATSEYTSPPWV